MKNIFKEIVVMLFLTLEEFILPGWRKETTSQEPWEVDYDIIFNEIVDFAEITILLFGLFWLILALFG